MTTNVYTVVLVLTGGVLAGAVNTIVGSGTLLTFPLRGQRRRIALFGAVSLCGPASSRWAWSRRPS
ncbi:hypothetical protein [Streptomyces acidiscabies]|uniref:Uncharacterized protein n=1 Tax=Streptomyces acidiscabies TaxID=42234 RepID=A0A0L0JSE8_9ACTN|nr:hypothetical protein [Streptomyces acidiscabies]KND28682.1 hypothetical protein IQ63_32745 [Streptomyces acidiscabies]